MRRALLLTSLLLVACSSQGSESASSAAAAPASDLCTPLVKYASDLSQLVSNKPTMTPDEIVADLDDVQRTLTDAASNLSSSGQTGLATAASAVADDAGNLKVRLDS